MSDFSHSKNQLVSLDCADEPIHIPEFIQGHGFMLIISKADFSVLRASANTSLYMNIPTEATLGKQWTNFLDHKTCESLQKALENQNLAALNPLQVQLKEVDQCFELTAHEVQENLVLEFEPLLESPDGLYQLYDQCLQNLYACRDFDTLIQTVVQEVRRLTGFDRVMVYRFDSDWNGEVIAEDKIMEADSYLGLHFPASDIPAQARALYTRNLLRIIVDAKSEPVPMLSKEPHAAPLDMSDCVLRAVSPIHIEYLQNMGVRTSMSVSILRQGKLWGLIACHHFTPKSLSFALRNHCKRITQLISSHLEFQLSDEEALPQKKQALEEQLIYKELSRSILENVRELNPADVLLRFNPTDGAGLFLHNHLYLAGTTPPEARMHDLLTWLSGQIQENLFYTHQLSLLYPPAEAYKSMTSGVLIIRISPLEEHYLIWFKQEKLQKIHWGGNPQKQWVKGEDDVLRVSPRKSFEKWTNFIKGRSKEWSLPEIRQALQICEQLKNVLIKQNSMDLDKMTQSLRKAIDDLDSFNYMISHDLKSPLRNIDNYTEILREEYYDQLDTNAQEIITTILESTHKMSNLIRDLLAYSRLGKAEKIYNIFPVMPILQDIIRELMSHEAQGRKVDIVIEAIPDIYGDRPLIRQLFFNLLSNAIKYTRPREKAQIHISGKVQDTENIYLIRDNGVGFDMRYVDKIFQVFSRLHNDSEFEGTGIGLAIVHRIIQTHQGRIWVESTLNQGTDFFLALPHPGI